MDGFAQGKRPIPTEGNRCARVRPLASGSENVARKSVLKSIAWQAGRPAMIGDDRMDLIARGKSSCDAARGQKERLALHGAESSQRVGSRRECIDMMMANFGVDAALVSVPKLSKVLGIAPSTLYGYIKSGKFFMPHRMVNQSPMVTIDDLIDWYQGRGEEAVLSHSTPDRGESPSKQSGQPILMVEVHKNAVSNEALAIHSNAHGEGTLGNQPAKFTLTTARRNASDERKARDREVDGWVAKAMAAIGQQSKEKKSPASRG